MTDQSKIAIAAIGVGHLGQHHARIYSENPRTKLVGVVDTYQEQAQLIAEKFNAPAYDDYRSIADQVDAVSIATPTETHFEIARFFLEKGIHVLLEKPISRTVKEAQELVEIAQKKNILLQIIIPQIISIDKTKVIR